MQVLADIRIMYKLALGASHLLEEKNENANDIKNNNNNAFHNEIR